MAESSRERLIDTADALFSEHGFHAIGLDQIIAQVGVTKTTFYNHFASKDDLIIAVLDKRDRRELVEWMEIVRSRGRDDARSQLMVLFEILDEWFKQEDFRGCMFIKAAAEFPNPNDPIHRAAAVHGARLYEEFRRIAGQAGAQDPDELTKQLMLLVSGSIVARHSDMAHDAALTARSAAEALIERQLPPVAASA